MKTYHGRRARDGAIVEVREDGRPPRVLDPRLDLWNHSPTGFEWGYPGSEPAQLALAILLHVTMLKGELDHVAHRLRPAPRQRSR